MRRFPRLKLTTLHTHLGTLIRDPQRYAEAVHRLAAFARQLRLQGLPPVETFDLGGGFASSILPLSRDEPANVPQPIEYASAIAAACREEFGVHPPQILLEAGRGLIDDCAALLTTVVAKKAGSDGREWLFVDAGVNSLPLALRQRFYVVPLCRSKDKEFVLPATSVDIFGPLCLPYDRLASDVALPSMATGDRLWFWPAGAYNVSQMTPFIEPRPAVVLLEEEGKPLLIRARDTVESLGFD
jgi:diaminopimelate decarboxylase